MAKVKSEIKRLYRSETDVIIAGVAGGLGEYFEIDPVIIRLLFLAAVFFGGFGVPIYLVLWIILPTKKSGEPATQKTINHNIAEMRGKAASLAEGLRGVKTGEKSKNTLAILLIVIGGILFLHKLGIIRFDFIWPLFLIGLGVFLFSR